MTELDWQKIISFIIAREGGSTYTNHKDDRGGGTRYGITDATYSAYRKSVDMPTQSVLYIEYPEEVYRIYKNNYWIPAGCDKMNDPKYALVIMDLSVNSGVSRALRYNSIANGDIKKLIEMRKEFYNRIVKNDPTQKVFLKGWMNRIKHVEDYIAAWDLIQF